MVKSILNHKAEIEKHENAIKKIQEKCLHPEETLEKVWGSTGGYDGPNFNSYWADFTCQRCGKRWRADSKENPQEYRREAKARTKR